VDRTAADVLGGLRCLAGSWHGEARGRWGDARFGYVLTAVSAALQLTPAAKRVTALARTYEVAGDVLRYTMAMSTDAGVPLLHREPRSERFG
jgi:hypothetical protein